MLGIEPGAPEEQPVPLTSKASLTILVSCIDICSQIQEALQAGQALRLLAGQVQGAALVDLSRGADRPCCLGPGRLVGNLLNKPKAGADPYPVPPVDVSPMVHQQLHHVRLVSQDGDVQGCVVGNWV